MYNLEKHLIVVLCNKKNWNRETFAQQLKEHTITWYSDAFKTKAETGIGVFVLKTNQPNQTSNQCVHIILGTIGNKK